MTETRTSQSRPPAASPARGVALVVVALLTAGFLVLKGPGDGGTAASDDAPTTLDVNATSETTTTVTTPPTAVDPATLAVSVVNAASTQGLAKSVADPLKAQGYAAAKTLTATSNLEASAVYFEDGYEADAKAVAAIIGIDAAKVAARPASIPVNSDEVTAKVFVMLGKDYDAAQAQGASDSATSAAATSTTAAG